ncbi:MAG: PKD domain-containing protein, partial [Bacteroidia bacterium]
TAGGGVPAYTYSWSPSGGSTNNATGLNPGNYTVTISDANLCTATASVTVSSTAAYTVTIVATPVSCKGGNDGSATATISGGTAPFIYQWLPSGGSTTSTGNTLIAGSYTLNTTETATGCQTSTIALITEPATSITVSANAQTICNGQSASITASAAGGNGIPYTYSWSNGGATATISVSPAASAVYTVTLTDSKNCITQDTVNIHVLPPLAVAVSQNDTLCQGQSATLAATPAGGNGNYTITWTPGPLAGSPVSVSPASSTIYTASLSDGCTVGTVSAAVQVVVVPVPVITYGSNPASGCSPVCPLFAGIATTVSGNDIDPLSWTWNFGDGSSATGINAAHCYSTPGTYYPSLHGTTTQGCIDSSSGGSAVYVYPDPVADFTASSYTSSIYDNTIDFSNLSTGVISSFDWNFANMGSSTLSNPSFTFEPEGNYEVTLTVQNAMGCTDNITKTIIILPEYTFYVPNAFSPAGGDELNDIFMALGTGWDPDKFNFWVYDRWGNKIFHSSDMNTGWNGKANGGKDVAQIDTYVWMIKHYDVFGKYHEYRGIVSLVK